MVLSAGRFPRSVRHETVGSHPNTGVELVVAVTVAVTRSKENLFTDPSQGCHCVGSNLQSHSAR